MAVTTSGWTRGPGSVPAEIARALVGSDNEIEPCGSHLGAAGIVDAREEHRVHDADISDRGITTRSADRGSDGTSHRNRSVAAAAPASCAPMNPGTSAGRMPANVSVSARATVTAGFANDVDAVNQYAAAMYAATANGTASARRREHPQITDSRPNVATNSLTSCAGPLRA